MQELFAEEDCIHCVPQASHFEPLCLCCLCPTGIPIPAPFISQVLMRIAKKDILCTSD